MPRKAREKSSTGIYHIMVRGINRQCIFEDEEDHIKFLQVLEKYKEICRYEIYAYCLMGNHVHLLLKTREEPLEQIMRRLCACYVYWYNTKYDRVGNLFQDRFKSEPIEDEAYFLTVLRYIHQNPLKAGLVKEIKSYKWSSYNEYLDKEKLVSIDYILSQFNADRKKAIKSFKQYNSELNNETCLDITKTKRISDEKARIIIKQVCEISNAKDLQKFNKLTRNLHINQLKAKHNLSIRQIERLTGINRGVIQKA